MGRDGITDNRGEEYRRGNEKGEGERGRWGERRSLWSDERVGCDREVEEVAVWGCDGVDPRPVVDALQAVAAVPCECFKALSDSRDSVHSQLLNPTD